METMTARDGRIVEYRAEGPSDGPILVFHHGTPAGAVRVPPIFDAAQRLGLRTLVHDRPGYGASTAHPGRRIADVADDVEDLLDAIGAGEFITVGWSGGGPHALACATLLPDRCRA